MTLSVLALASAPLEAATTTGECREVDPDDAVARGHAVALRVTSTVLSIQRETARSESIVIGPGDASDDAHEGTVSVPADGSIARVALPTSAVSSGVTTDLSSTQNSVAQVLDVSLLNGFITASTVRAEGTARTRDGMADITGSGTVLQDLVVGGQRMTEVAPNTKVDLPAELFGDKSSVMLYERIDKGIFPDANVPIYRTNIAIRMIHVVATDFAGQTVDIVVSESFAHAQTPTAFCGGLQGVVASAYVARLKDSTAPNVLVGHVEVPVTGGFSEQTYANLDIPFGNNQVTVDSATTRASGQVVLGVSSDSDAVSKLAGVCVRVGSDPECVVFAELIRSESHSRAFPDASDPGDVDAISWGSVTIANVTVDGVNVCNSLGLQDVCQPPKNMVRKIGDFTVYLNQRERDMDPEGHTEYWVRAVRIEGPGLGSVTLGRTYTGADYGTRDDT